MNTEVVHPAACVIQHITIIVIAGSNGDDVYCGLTTHVEGNQIHCAITHRMGSHEPVASVFIVASQYVKTNLLPNRKMGSIVWIDDAFEITSRREILHGFELVKAGTDGEITRQSVDLKTHEAWTSRVQPAVKLILELGA